MSTQGQINTSQLTPEYLQQLQLYQDNMKRQALAQSLMGNQANPNTPNAGIANAGSDIAGALVSRKIQDNNKWAAQGLGPVNVTGNRMPGQGGWFNGLFGMGGS
jgi:hypothetical protein